jgi:hypothetical protein
MNFAAKVPFFVAQNVLISLIKEKDYKNAMNLLGHRPELATTMFIHTLYMDMSELLQKECENPSTDINDPDLLNLILYPYHTSQAHSPLNGSRQIRILEVMAFFYTIGKMSTLLQQHAAHTCSPAPFVEFTQRFRR